MLLPIGRRDPKVDIHKLNKLKVPLTVFVIYVGGVNWVASGTPKMITRPRRK